MKMAQNGIISYFKSAYFPPSGQCRVSGNRKSTKSKRHSLNFSELTVAFLMLGVGLSMASLAFLIEAIFGYKKQPTQN